MTKQQLLQQCTLVTTVLAALCALAVLAGWHSGSRQLVGLGLSPVAVHYNSALAVLFSAASMLCYARHLHATARLLAIPTLLIGIAHFLQFLLKARWGLDFWFHQWISDTEFTPTLNLAPSLAIMLFLFAAVQVSLTAPDRPGEGREKLLRDVSLAVLAIAGVALWAIVDQSSDYGWGNLARMAPGSIVMLALLALGGIALSSSRIIDRKISASLQLFIRLLVPVVMACSVVLWAELANSEARHIRENIRQQAAMTLSGLEHSLQSQAYSLRRMANRLNETSQTDQESWRRDAQHYLRDHTGLSAIGFRKSQHADTHWAQQVTTADDFLGETFAIALREASFSKEKLAVSLPSTLKRGNSQFMIVSPSGKPGSGGAIVAVFDGAALLQGVISPAFLNQLHTAVWLGNRQLFESTAQRDVFYRYWGITDEVEILGKTWMINVWPTPAYYNEIRANLQDLVLIAGLIISALLMYSSQLLERSALTAKKLAESQGRLQLLLDNAGEGIFGLDLEGCTTFLNKTAERITGFNAEEMLYKKQHTIIHHSHADGSTYPVEQCNIYRVLREGGSHFERNEVFWRKNRTCYPVEYTSAAITDNKGQVNGAVVVFRDISELKEIENKLKATNEELEGFAYLASHDLKAPLRVISNAAQWLEEDLAPHLSEDDRENMELLQSRVQRMDQLLDDLLNYSRIGRVTDDRFNDKVNGQDMMDNILQLLSPPPTITVTVDPAFSEVTLTRMPLQQMIYNLIANAIKHHDSDSGHIAVGVKSVANDYVFTVEDDGPGIESKYHNKIFEIFRTLKPRDQVEGSGIGLSVVKKYADIYGGRIELNSQVGKGSRFTIVWPKNTAKELNS